MTLEYERTPEHWTAANIALFENSERGKKRLRALRGVVGGLCLVVSILVFLAVAILAELALPLRIFGVVACAVVTALATYHLTPVMARSEIKQVVQTLVRRGRHAEFFGKKRVTLDDEGLRIRGETAEELHFWKRVREVLVTESYILFRIGENQLMELPKSLFATPQHQAEFLAAVERYRQEQASPSPEPQRQAWYQSKDQVG
ncbi:YcxB family protein [Armatimonas rosea]|uniref:YcxB-like C-terminal domain-containing protein n=1 Tax=Armatimonas rosea TaxID=685828 RepID=A0A7W9SQV2_ARMRO|nr:hypothetical protein [Armatimonas rosea]